MLRNAHVSNELVLFAQWSNCQQPSKFRPILSYQRYLFLKLPRLRRGFQKPRDERLNRFGLVKYHDALLAYDLVLSPTEELLRPDTIRGDCPFQIAGYSGSTFSL